MSRERKLVVFGAGGHGKVVADLAMHAGFSLAGFVDDAPALCGSSIWGYPVLGGREWLGGIDPERYTIALGIGDNHARMALTQWLLSRRFHLETVVSPSAVVSPSVCIGPGTIIMPGVVVSADAFIGEGVILNTAAIVEHDTTIGHYAHVSPNAALGGGVRVGILAHIGIGATVLPSVRVGCRSILGAGSVVARDIPDDVIAFGSPARVQRTIASGLATISETIV